MMSYEEYLQKTGQRDSLTSWKWWKIEIFGMTEREAIKAAIKYYEPIKESVEK